MNTKHFSTFSFFFFIVTQLLVSCSSEDSFVVCRVSEYDCDYQHKTNGIISVTKGSSRRHYILTEKGMKQAKIEEGEPIAFNPETGTAVVKQVTDSTIDVFAVDTRNGKMLSSEISLKPKMTGKDGKTFFAVPTLISACSMNNGTIVLLINYEKPALIDSGAASESYDFLYVYEKGDVKKLKKYMFPYDEEPESGTEEKANQYFWEEPKKIQCGEKNIYVFSERNYASGDLLFYNPQATWILDKIDLGNDKEIKISTLAFIAYDNILLNNYSEKENSVYSVTQSSGKEKETAELRILRPDEDGENPEEPLEKEGGDFLFSETSDGKLLVFFLKTRSHLEEQKIELLPF